MVPIEASRPSNATVSVNLIDVYWAGVAVMDHPARHRVTCRIASPYRHLQTLLDEWSVFHRRRRPADDRPREQVDSERDVDEPGPRYPLIR
jgi:hypothetical protein